MRRCATKWQWAETTLFHKDRLPKNVLTSVSSLSCEAIDKFGSGGAPGAETIDKFGQEEAAGAEAFHTCEKGGSAGSEDS